MPLKTTAGETNVWIIYSQGLVFFCVQYYKRKSLYAPILFKDANGANTKLVVTGSTKVRPFHQCSLNYPSNTPAWWAPVEEVPDRTPPKSHWKLKKKQRELPHWLVIKLQESCNQEKKKLQERNTCASIFWFKPAHQLYKPNNNTSDIIIGWNWSSVSCNLNASCMHQLSPSFAHLISLGEVLNQIIDGTQLKFTPKNSD